jgi:hypothetical protein
VALLLYRVRRHPAQRGKPVRFKGMSVFDLAGGKIAA